MEFKEYLKLIRKQENLTQYELAGMLRCSQSAVSAWEKGINTPNLEQLGWLWRILPISLDELFGERQRRSRRFRPQKRVAKIISLRNLREGRGLSRAKLAEILDVSEKTVENWERKGIPHIGQIKKLMRLFHVDINELY